MRAVTLQQPWARLSELSEPADPGKVWVVDRLGQEYRDAHRMNSDAYGDYSEMAAVAREANQTAH